MFKVIFGFAAWLFCVHVCFGATLLQQEAGTFAFEAEDYSTLTGSNWSTISTTAGQKLIPDGSNAVGDAIYANNGGSPTSFVTYDLQFIADGTYYIYTKYSMYDRSTSDPPSYGNEDSFFIARDFGIAAALGGGADTDWFAQHVPSQGHLPSDSPTPNPNEGLYFYWDEGQLSGTSTSPLTFVVSGASEETPLSVTFTIGNREGGLALDRFVFSTTRLNSDISGGNSTILDGIASAPEPSRGMFLLLALVGLIARRTRQA